MPGSVLARSVVIWFLLTVLAIANGALRVGILIPRFGELAGHIVSTLLLCFIIALVTWIALPWIAPGTRGIAARIGALWLLMTLSFEFGAGHYLMGQPWSALLADYHLANGRIWPLVLITTAVAPIVVARLRNYPSS